MLEHFGQRAIWLRAHAIKADRRPLRDWANSARESYRSIATSDELYAQCFAAFKRRMIAKKHESSLAWWRKYGEQL